MTYIKTDTRIFAALAAAIVSACDPGPTIQDKIAMVESIKREAEADIIRQQGQCAAVAHEFQRDPAMVATCAESLRVVTMAASSTIADADRRLAELRTIK